MVACLQMSAQAGGRVLPGEVVPVCSRQRNERLARYPHSRYARATSEARRAGVGRRMAFPAFTATPISPALAPFLPHGEPIAMSSATSFMVVQCHAL